MKLLKDDKNQWEVLYFKIKEKILNKELLSGQKLESQNILSKKNNISRYSVRKAIKKLENENVIISHQGKGSFITKNIYRVHLSKNSKFHLNALLEKGKYKLAPYAQPPDSSRIILVGSNSLAFSDIGTNMLASTGLRISLNNSHCTIEG